MRRLILTFLALLIIFFPLGVSAQDSDPCAGLIAPLLIPGEGARISADDGIGVVLRDAPSINGAALATLPEGSLIMVLHGYTCTDQRVWWEVRLPDGRGGYIPEGSTNRYYAHLDPIGTDIYQIDPMNAHQLNHFRIDAAGVVHIQPSISLIVRPDPAVVLWQNFELNPANLALADRMGRCPDKIAPSLLQAGEVGKLTFEKPQRWLYPSYDGTQTLMFSEYSATIPECENDQQTIFGTNYVSLIAGGQERVVFVFSQTADPPLSQFCQPPFVVNRERITAIDEVVWSQDGRHVALGVRYLRNSDLYPCAYYHVFVIDTQTMTIIYAGEGRRIAWGQGGHRLYFARIERSDPNAPGIEHLFSTLPDGSAIQEIPLPSGATWLPGAMDIHHTILPWMESGDAMLGCSGNVYDCANPIIFDLTQRTVSASINAPAQLGGPLRSVHFVEGDTRLLWLDETGILFLQTLEGEVTRIELEVESRVIAVQPLPGGVGAILQLEDGRYLYYDILSSTVRQIVGLGG